MPQLNQLKLYNDTKTIVESGWCREAYARDSDGFPVVFESNKATSFCLMGATYRAALMQMYRSPIIQEICAPYIEALEKYTKGTMVSVWNDHQTTTKEDVIRLLDQVIADIQK